MDWTHVFTIIGVLGGFMFFMMQRVEKDISNVNSSIETIGRRLDNHAQRIDQLYKMFCDTQKEIKEIYKDWSKERK